MQLAAECHTVARKLPREDAGPLRSQMLRAMISVPANIAEGNGRRSRADYLRHLSIANGSLLELETHLQLAVLLRYTRPESIASAMTVSAETGRMLNGLIRKLREPPKG